VKVVRETQLSAPVEVTWMLTNRCNLGCNFCMVESGPHPAVLAEELNAEEQLALAEDLGRSGVLRVVLTGGEPLLLPQLPQLVACLHRGGVQTYLTTNATLLDAELAESLRAAGLNEAQISIAAADDALNDRIMGGRHSRKHILRGIAHLRQAGLPMQAKLTVTADNVRSIPELCRQLFALGVGRIKVAEVGNSGRAAANMWRLRPALNELLWLEEALADYSEPTLSFSSHSLSQETMRRARGVAHPSPCTLGERDPVSAVLFPSGNLIPCNSVWIWGKENNARQRGFIAAWRRLREIYRPPQNLPAACRECRWLDECRGGCPAQATLAQRPVDPACPLLARREGVALFRHRGRVTIPIGSNEEA